MLENYGIFDGKLAACSAEAATIHVYVNPDEAEKKDLVDRLKIDEHTLNSALDPDELSRLEFEPDHAAMIYKRPKNYSSEEQFVFKVASSGLFLFKDRLVIVMPEKATIFEGRQFLRVGSLLDVILKLVYRSIFHFEEHLKVINMISAELEHQINTAMENKHLLNLFTLEKSLVYYLNAISSNASLVEKLKMNSAKLGMTTENVEFLDDTMIENSQCLKQADVYSQVLAGMMDARASIVNNNLNVLMKTLNIIMIGIMMPSLVVAMFSMNVGIPLAENPHAFWIISALAVGSTLLVGFIWWLPRRPK